MKRIFVCENSVDGIFTGIYDAWASRLGHDHVALRIEGQQNLELFSEYQSVKTDSEKAAKVARSVRSKMGMDAYQTIYQSALSSDERRADCLYRVIVKGMTSYITREQARKVIWNLQDPNVCRVFELSRIVGHEVCRYKEFVRFRELDNQVLFSEIHAENEILPMLGDHFADRFPNENFMIYDNGHHDCLIHEKQSRWYVLRDTVPDTYAKDCTSEREQEMQKLWKGFCKSISIEARENRKLQMQHWPLKYRQWMTEG